MRSEENSADRGRCFFVATNGGAEKRRKRRCCKPSLGSSKNNSTNSWTMHVGSGREREQLVGGEDTVVLELVAIARFLLENG